MAGIAGIAGCSDSGLAKRMIKTLRHRGPTSPQYFSDNELVLAACSLESGDSPREVMDSTGGHCAVIDGGLDNHDELLMDLESKGKALSKGSDPELLIRMNQESGKDFLSRLEGMFAFALWDGQRLLLGRDRLGGKPLFYATPPEEGLLLFASEIRAILQHDFKRTVNTHAFCQRKLIHHMIGTGTSLREVHQVPPGHAMVVDMGERTNRVHTELIRGRVLEMRPQLERSEKETLSLLKTALLDSAERHLSSDEPFGVFLSGGLDSTLLVFILSRLADRPINTFTFADQGECSDMAHARDVAAECNTTHTETEIDPDSVVQELPRIVATSEGLFGGFSFYMFSKEIRNRFSHIKKVLSGEGPDELFGGYRYFKDVGAYKKELLQKLKELGNIGEVSPIRSHVREVFSDGLDSFLLDELGDQLANSHMLFADHNGMAHGIEICAPYLSDGVVDLTTTIPSKLKVNSGITKYILRKVAEDVLPAELRGVIERRKVGAPGSVTNMIGRLRRLSEKMLSDRDVENHRFRTVADRKLNVLLLDLFEYLFVENDGIVPSNFEISDLY